MFYFDVYLFTYFFFFKTIHLYNQYLGTDLESDVYFILYPVFPLLISKVKKEDSNNPECSLVVQDQT